ncbi:MAG: hypothetical protein ACJAVM_000736 [Sulfitobacter sp.]|jgi:hypothetical protein
MMTTALTLIAHAIRMLVFETGTTLRVVMPALIMVLGSTLAMALVTPEVLLALNAPPEAIHLPPASDITLMMVFALVALLGYVLLSVLWHRHVLISDDQRDGHEAPTAGILLRYIGKAIVVALLQMLATIPILLATAAIGAVLGITAQGGATAFSGMIVGLLAGLAFIWLALRISIVLPAAALGNNMRVTESWQQTARIATPLWGVAVLLAAINLGISSLTGIISPNNLVLAMLVGTTIYLIEGLIFISVLTTLYGHLVEGRPLG